MKSEKARELLERYEYSKESAIKAVEIAEQELYNKFRDDIHLFAEKWRDSDKKIDAIHISEMNELRAEIATLRTALDEANKRCEIAQKVIADKNAKRGASGGGGAAEREGMSLNDYQTRAMGTCLPESRNPMYMLFGLAEEVGELCGKFAKAIRKGEIVITDNGIEYTEKCDKEAFIEAVQKEGGDVEWMLNGFFSVMGWTADSIANGNLSKLAARKQNNTIVSHTDH